MVDDAIRQRLNVSATPEQYAGIAQDWGDAGLARVMDGHAAKRATVRIGGAVRPDGEGAVQLTISVNGEKSSWKVPRATSHEAAYSAAISALMDAHAAGVTHLTLQTPANLVRRQLTGEWSVTSPNLKRMELLYELFRIDFDDVDWVAGPA